MAKLSGKVVYIYPTAQLTSKSGNTFTKRDFVIALQTFDRDTGEPAIDPDNTPQLTLTGDRCAQLDGVTPGDIVSVDFYLRGRRYRDPESNKEKIITDINVTSVRVTARALRQPETAAAATASEATPAAAPPAQSNDDLPF